jgi:hypothetical protein
MTDSDIDHVLKSHLTESEKLIWTGRPRRGVSFRNTDIYLIPFSLLWCGFAIFWELNALRTEAPLFFKIWGIPFILVGIYITIGRFLFDAQKRANTIYGITNDRIIIRSGIFSKEIKSLNIRSLTDITIKEKSDNSGTITLASASYWNPIMQGMDWPGVKQPPALEMIENVKHVYDKIIFLQRQK